MIAKTDKPAANNEDLIARYRLGLKLKKNDVIQSRNVVLPVNQLG